MSIAAAVSKTLEMENNEESMKNGVQFSRLVFDSYVLSATSVHEAIGWTADEGILKFVHPYR